jgi:hypothetical protein
VAGDWVLEMGKSPPAWPGSLVGSPSVGRISATDVPGPRAAVRYSGLPYRDHPPCAPRSWRAIEEALAARLRSTVRRTNPSSRLGRLTSPPKVKRPALPKRLETALGRHQGAAARRRWPSPAPGSALGGPPGARWATHRQGHEDQGGRHVTPTGHSAQPSSSAPACPARGHRVKGGPPGRRPRWLRHP